MLGSLGSLGSLDPLDPLGSLGSLDPLDGLGSLGSLVVSAELVTLDWPDSTCVPPWPEHPASPRHATSPREVTRSARGRRAGEVMPARYRVEVLLVTPAHDTMAR